MLYFYLNTTNFIDPLINGEERSLGIIKVSFFNNVFSTLSKAKAYMDGWSEYPPFLNIPSVKGKGWILDYIDDESVESTMGDILVLMEKAHSVTIPYVGKSLAEMGLHYDFVIHIPNRQVNLSWCDYLAENNLQYIEEAIGDRNMTLHEKIAFFSSELLSIGSEGVLLTIVDPYIFPKRCDADYSDLFISIVRASKVASLKIITDSHKYNPILRQSIESQLSVSMVVYASSDLHDRWWIVESKKKAIICGTSLNGFGKGKLTTVNTLMQNDVEKIINDISGVFQII